MDFVELRGNVNRFNENASNTGKMLSRPVKTTITTFQSKKLFLKDFVVNFSRIWRLNWLWCRHNSPRLASYNCIPINFGKHKMLVHHKHMKSTGFSQNLQDLGFSCRVKGIWTQNHNFDECIASLKTSGFNRWLDFVYVRADM